MRNIFEYSNGETQVMGDPLEIHLTFVAECGGDPNQVIAETSHEDPGVWMPAVKKFLHAVHIAFKMKDYDYTTGQGAQWQDHYDVYEQWRTWESQLKKDGGSEPTSSSAAEPPISPVSGKKITRPSAVSG